MGFTEAIKSCFSNYGIFDGRAARSEYWYFALLSLILGIFTGIIDTNMGQNFGEGPATMAFWLLFVIPSLSVTARRLHDTNRPGWWLIVAFIPIIGIIVLIVWLCTDGTPERNKYGDPINISHDSFGRPSTDGTPEANKKERVDETQAKEVIDEFNSDTYVKDGVVRWIESDNVVPQDWLIDFKENMKAPIQNSPINKTVEKLEKITPEKNMPKNEDIINKEIFDDIDDEEYYLTATKEVEGENINAALWAKCMAINTGDEKKSKYDYINRRVEGLKAKQAEAKRIAEEEEAKRIVEEKEAKRIAEEEEAKRIVEEEEAKRIVEEKEAKRIVEEKEAKRIAEEAEAKRIADEAEAKRIAEEAEAKRVAKRNAKRIADEAEAKRIAEEAEAKRVAKRNAKTLERIVAENKELNLSNKAQEMYWEYDGIKFNSKENMEAYIQIKLSGRS